MADSGTPTPNASRERDADWLRFRDDEVPDEPAVSLDATAFFLLTSNPAQFPFPVPSDPGLIGVTINTQALTLSPGANALGALTSNGIEMRIGQ